MQYEDRIDSFGIFLLIMMAILFLVIRNAKEHREEASAVFMLVTKAPLADTFKVRRLPFESAYVDECKNEN